VVDIDRYIAQHSPAWDRLDVLSRTAAARVKKLRASEIDELVRLYQQSSGHLAYVRTHFDDPGLIGRLSLTVGTARGAIYRKRQQPVAAATRFFSLTLPAVIWDLRRVIGVAALLFYGSALAAGLWFGHSDEALKAEYSPEEQRLIAESQFEDYYSSSAAEEFGTQVTTNNIRVSFTAFAGGILVLPTAVGLLANGFHVGELAAVMYRFDAGAKFWGLILPHGLLETFALCIASAAGLRLGWSLLVPGDRTRTEALAEEGARSVVAVLGCTLLFVAAGITESFVTPSGLPTAIRIAIGTLLLLGAMTWLFGLGRNAAAAGYTGRLGER